MGKTTILAVLGISDEEMTPHGFRAIARTLLDKLDELRVGVAVIA